MTNDFIDFSKNSYSSIAEVFKKVLDINERSLLILQGITDAMVRPDDPNITSDDFVTIKLKDLDKSGIPLEYKIPTLSSLSKKVIDMRGILENLRNQKILEYEDREVNKLSIYSSPNSIKEAPILKVDSIELNDNPLFDRFFDRMFTIPIDLSKSVSPLAKSILISRYRIKFEDLPNGFEGIPEINLQTKGLLENYLTTSKITFSKDEKSYSLPEIKLESDGEFRVVSVKSPEIIVLNDFTFKHQEIELDSTSLKTRKEGDLKLVKGDSLTKGFGNYYKIDSFSEKKNTIVVEYSNESSPIKIADNLHFASKLDSTKELSWVVSPTCLEILFFKDLSPNINIASPFFSSGVPINPKTIQFKDSTIYDVFLDSIFDFSEFFGNLKSEMGIPASAGITPNKPVLLKENFKVIRLNAHRFSSGNPEINNLLNKYTYTNARLNELYNIKLGKSNAINDFLAKGGKTTDSIAVNLDTELKDILTEIVSTENSLNEIRTQLKTLQYEIPKEIDSKYSIQGWWEFPHPKRDSKKRVQDIVAFDVEYSYLDLGKNQKSTPIGNWTKLDGSVIKGIFPQNTVKRTATRKKKENPLTNRMEWTFSESDDTIQETEVNTTRIPISPNEVVMVRVRSISEAGFPNNPVKSEWSDPIYVEFPDEFMGIETVEESKKQILTNTLNGNNNDLMVETLLEQVESLKKELKSKLMTNEYSGWFEITELNLNGQTVYTFHPNMIRDSFAIWNAKTGTILNPRNHYSITNNDSELIFNTDYTRSLEVGDLFFVRYKVSKI